LTLAEIVRSTALSKAWQHSGMDLPFAPPTFTEAQRTMPVLAQAMVLAAGRGERMRPLTDHTPKPLLNVRGQALMQWPMQALARAGFTRQLINTAWLGEQIAAHFGTHPVWPDTPGVRLMYSHEGQDFGHALETAGGIVRAMPRLEDVFWVVAGDVFAPDFVFTPEAVQRFAASENTAHLWLVPNPAHNPGGDFGLSDTGMALNLPRDDAGRRFTFSTIALYKQAFFSATNTGIETGNPQGIAAPLAPLLRAAMDKGQVSGEVYRGAWADVGTPERLAQLNASVT
jgi:MurNAc alpha-1-phosphate uridylyltransferase